MGLDERTSEELRQWLRKARVYLWAFLAGGSLAFAYTYFPLHGAKERKIEHLEDRLAQEVARQTEFEEKFQAMQAQIETQSDRAALGELQEELAGAASRQRESEGKLARADREIRDLESSRQSWKTKYARLEKSRDDLAHALIVANASLKAAEERVRVAGAALGSSLSQKESSAADPYRNDREPSLAKTEVRPATRALWDADTGTGPHPASPAPEATPTGAN